MIRTTERTRKTWGYILEVDKISDEQVESSSYESYSEYHIFQGCLPTS